MALIDADFPSSSHGIYGTDQTKMLDGKWAQNVNSACFIVNDPDPIVGSSGYVLGTQSSSSGAYMRKVLPSTYTTLGVASRLWMKSIPSNLSLNPRIVTWATAANVALATVFVNTSGQIVVCTGGSTGGTVLAQSTGPVVTANAWWHIECKYVIDAVNGSVEVRVNGVTQVLATGLNTGTTPIGQIYIGSYTSGQGIQVVYYYKDLVIWDNSGTTDNDFFGSVTVFYRKVTGTITIGGWTLSAGSTAANLIDGPRPSNVLTATANLTPDGTNNIRIDNTYYRPVTGSVDAGTPAGTSTNPWLFALGVDAATSLANLFNAINASGTPGTTYSTALTAHPTVSAVGYDATRVLVQSDDGQTTTYSCTETMASASWASSTMNSIVPQDLAFIAADSTPPAACEFDLEDLPSDITSVRGIIPVIRGAKVDGGDGNIQLSLSPNGTNYTSGPDTPLTTAFTFWPNNTSPFVSMLDPATSSPWTPSAFNGARLKINRTL